MSQGVPILDYLLEPLLELPDLSELIFIIGDNGEQVREYVERYYHLPATYIWQNEQKGLGHAISLAKERDNGEPLLILLGDKIFEYGYQKNSPEPLHGYRREDGRRTRKESVSLKQRASLLRA